MVKKKVGGSKRHEKKSLKVKADTATKQPGSAFAAAGSAGRRGGPPPPGHVKRKMARKLHFLDKLAASQTAAAAAAGGGSGSPACVRVRAGGSGVKKLKAKRRPIKALQDLSTLTEALGDALAASQTKSSNRRVSQGAGPGGGDGAAHQASSKHSRGRAIITAQENARVQQVPPRRQQGPQ